MNNILILDDEVSILTALKYALEDLFNVYVTPDVKEALEYIDTGKVDLVLLDQLLGDYHGMDVLKAIKKDHPNVIVIAMTAYGNIENSIEAIQNGAYYYITKPVDINGLRTIISKALDYKALSNKVEDLTKQISMGQNPHQLISSSKVMDEVQKIIERVKDLDVNVLITGESGTGKELIAKAIHYGGNRKDANIESVNCAAIPGNLLESELFGYEKGAFTGANTKRKGKFELADGGTIFLDEIGDLDLPFQAKLLRVIQEKTVTPLGSERPIPLDFRLIAATNKNLEYEVKKGRFREDLYFRLNVINIEAPPLRKRKDDIPGLVKFFMIKYSQMFLKKVYIISRSAVNALETYDFPGNVRELENIIERAVALSDKDTLELYDLPKHIVDSSGFSISTESVPIFLGDTLETAEKKLILATLAHCNNNKRQTAKILELSERQLYNKLNKYKDEYNDD